MHYFPFDNQRVFRTLPTIAKRLVGIQCTVGQLVSFLLRGVDSGCVYEQLQREHIVGK